MFLNRIAASAGDDRSVYGDFYFEPLGNRTSSGMRVTPAAALGLPIVWAGGGVRVGWWLGLSLGGTSLRRYGSVEGGLGDWHSYSD